MRLAYAFLATLLAAYPAAAQTPDSPPAAEAPLPPTPSLVVKPSSTGRSGARAEPGDKQRTEAEAKQKARENLFDERVRKATSSICVGCGTPPEKRKTERR